ncbi:MAG: hypothetical protein A2808_02045 [Candidatus Moranbacteria bacterium RIFCSPHIGHO2_01_FULL_55_24]|nr:MAG: hypothetical protein A2808_02045 [Candidatus Moranbacteria bacterium RIFCSPHIGHO2_01_FULL_55_24]
MQLGIYRHYKGREYLVIGIAKYEENLEDMVIYQALYDDYTLWARKREVFEEQVDIPEAGYSGPRFQFVRPFTPEDLVAHPQALWTAR